MVCRSTYTRMWNGKNKCCIARKPLIPNNNTFSKTIDTDTDAYFFWRRYGQGPK